MLSSTEVEYISISGDKKIKLIDYLLKDLYVELILQIVVMIENVGTIFMSKIHQLAFKRGMRTLVITISEYSSNMA
jgi:hypothetical protein